MAESHAITSGRKAIMLLLLINAAMAVQHAGIPENSQTRPPKRQREKHPRPQTSMQSWHAGRKHYKWYYSTEPAISEMTNPPHGLHEFLRGYLHLKSGSWSKNKPHPLTSWSASKLAKMPYYYIMPLDATMPEAIATAMAHEDVSDVQNYLSCMAVG
ncbi:epoxide hydrolase [Paracoccidioides lutzii Pb01]|uniref:Epoxide hydrolase n=1 Tax=Paracoccidioides lutzii (strain ATCC MYA-826 / Pb01) TaxID=502779 RepID=C1GZZ2_PARBA|nr:epoxide hydrolase [Paracoccidioides lutzii Pb01]EEH33033.2 epoxide hydrolase [Paracoccidioides lutzii Pb01]